MNEPRLTSTSIGKNCVLKTQPIESVEGKRLKQKRYRPSEDPAEVQACLTCNQKRCFGGKECMKKRKAEMEGQK